VACAVFTRLPSGWRHIYTGQPVKNKDATSLQAWTVFLWLFGLLLIQVDLTPCRRALQWMSSWHVSYVT
jgi:hypothetical protein